MQTQIFSDNPVHQRKAKIYAGYVSSQDDTDIEFSVINTRQASAL